MINFNKWCIIIMGLIKTKNNIYYVLYTDYANADYLENQFRMFRLQNGNNRNSTLIQFY